MRKKTKPTEVSTTYIITQKKQLPPMHRQARSYLKTTARLVGRDMEQTLFTLPTYQSNINPYKEALSKNTAILGNHLFNLWQKDKDDRGILTIENLTKVAKELKTLPQELKFYLICLGGYQYPVVRFNKEKRILSVYHDKLFFIKFNIRLKEGEKEGDFTNDNRIGTNYVNYIRERSIDTVEISPSQSLIEELNSKGLGNVLVDDSFVAFSLGLSDLAYKVFCFSGSNIPTFKIGFKKLISKKYLNLEKQVYGVYDDKGNRIRAGHGKPRILKNIKRALDELLDKGHLLKWEYDEVKDMFGWSYTDKIIKHRDLLPIKIEE